MSEILDSLFPLEQSLDDEETLEKLKIYITVNGDRTNHEMDVANGAVTMARDPAQSDSQITAPSSHKGRTASDTATGSFVSDGTHNDDPAIIGGYGR